MALWYIKRCFLLVLLQPCENCVDLPIVLVGTKSDLRYERQVREDAGHAAASRFGCAKFKEISTRESIEDVAEVFEHSCRQGWLFRQHRELTKHRTMSILPVPAAAPPGASSAPASATAAGPSASVSSLGSSFEKSISLDST